MQLLGFWATNPRVGGLNPGLGLAVMTLSKSLYPHCSSIPTCSCKNRDLASAGTAKMGQKHQSH